MNFTYFNTATSSTTPAPAFNQGQAGNIVIRKIIVGNPVSGGTLIVFNDGNALSNNTTNIAFNLTLPTFSTTNINSAVPLVIDFRGSSEAGGGSVEADGLQLTGGGSMAISTTMQVTVLWDLAEGN